MTHGRQETYSLSWAAVWRYVDCVELLICVLCCSYKCPAWKHSPGSESRTTALLQQDERCAAENVNSFLFVNISVRCGSCWLSDLAEMLFRIQISCLQWCSPCWFPVRIGQRRKLMLPHRNCYQHIDRDAVLLLFNYLCCLCRWIKTLHSTNTLNEPVVEKENNRKCIENISLAPIAFYAALRSAAVCGKLT